EDADPPGPENPEGEVDRRADQPPLRIEVTLLETQRLVGVHEGVAGPRIDVRGADGDRDAEDQHHDHRTRGGAERTTQQDAPLAAGDVLKAEDAERAGDDLEPEEVARKIRAERRLAAGNP